MRAVDFSIVVPLYNKRRFVRQTLQSVLDQSAWTRRAEGEAPTFEIVVVDDGSTDDGAAKVRQMAGDGAPIRLLQQANAGVSVARNLGISRATGRWVACLDADDLLEPSFFATVMQMQLAFPHATVLATGHSSFQGGHLIRHQSTTGVAGGGFELIENLPERWLGAALLHVCSTVVRRDVLQGLQPCFPPGERCGEDLSFLFRLNHEHAVVYCPQPLLRYRRDVADGLSATVDSDELRGFWARLRREFVRDGATPQRMKSLDRFIAKARTLRAAELLERNRLSEAARMLGEVPPGLRMPYWWRTKLLALRARAFPGGKAASNGVGPGGVGVGGPDVEGAGVEGAGVEGAGVEGAGSEGGNGGAPVVSIVIKAFNEQDNIERAVTSALAALGSVPGEVILADSLSTDATVEIAGRHPIRIVRLRHAADRSCGVGAQLGYQHARGRFVYILDGDMRMGAEFIPRALAFMDANPRAAGVGGEVSEQNLAGIEYLERAQRGADHMQIGQVSRLDSGGLYRREAVESVGYLTDRNLHSYEEVDLGARLRAQGWTLHRLPVHSVDHWGHSSNAFGLLIRRWRSRYLFGIGEVLRAALGRPHWTILVRELREAWIYLMVLGWVLAMVGAAVLLPVAGGWILLVSLLPWVAISLRKRSVTRGTYSVYSWLMCVVAMIGGLLSTRRSPHDAIDSEVLR